MNVGFYLPITVDGLKSEDILAATKSDKKMEQGTIKFILLSLSAMLWCTARLQMKKCWKLSILLMEI